MIALNERYITDADGKRVGVILDIATFEQIVEALEDAEDEAWAADYERRKAASQLTPDELETVPLDQAIAEIEAEWAAEERTE
jgi:hypothetical protein